jgi:hypothetical protein
MMPATFNTSGVVTVFQRGSVGSHPRLFTLNPSGIPTRDIEQIRILEAMAPALYREWFVHFRFPGHEKTKFVPSPLGRRGRG